MTAYSPDPRDLAEAAAERERASSLLARRARYSRWDGTQSLPDLEADDVMDALADDLLADGDVASALRRLMERGLASDDPGRPDLPGLRDLLERLERRRE